MAKIVFDENGRSIDNIILDVNLAYEKHSGLRREQVIGRGFKEIFPPIVEQRWLDRYGEVVRTGMGMHFEDTTLLLTDGSKYLQARWEVIVSLRSLATSPGTSRQKRIFSGRSNIIDFYMRLCFKVWSTRMQAVR